jgi:nickel/cobalt transporter (NicO) family protein
MSATVALLAAAAGVGFGHAILPDHWVPLAVLGRARRYPLARVARLSGLAGIAHVLVSILIGGLVIAVGLQFRSAIQSAQSTIIGSILILTGLAFAAVEMTGRGHSHKHDDAGHSHAHTHEHPRVHGQGGHGAHPDSAPAQRERLHGLAAVMIPFGAAASPDLTILPVFLAATTVGVGTAITSVAVFAVVTVGTIVGLTLLACFGGYQLSGRWLDRWGNAFTALTLVIIGVLVLAGVI